MYGLLVGEFGIDHGVFLQELRIWQVLQIIKGRRRREETQLKYDRLNTWLSILPHLPKDSGVRDSPSELYQLPSEASANEPSDDEIEEMQREMAEYNENLRKSREQNDDNGKG